MFAQKGFKYIKTGRRAALKTFFFKQGRSRSGGSREQGLLGYEISDHTQEELVLYARAAALKRFVNRVDPDQAVPVRAA